MANASAPGKVASRSHRTAVALAVGLVAMLAGCAAQHDVATTGSIPDDYRQRHPIVIGEDLKVMDVPNGPNTSFLSTRMRGNVTGFAQRFVESNSSALAIVLPRGSANERSARRMAPQIEATLIGAGVPRKAIEHRIYQAEPQENEAPIRLAFVALSAKTKPCDGWPDQMADTTANRHYYNYGCASQQNLAAMVANPLDLLYPRGTSPADPERRGNVLDHYRKGEPYQSDYGRVAGGSVAQGVGQ